MARSQSSCLLDFDEGQVELLKLVQGRRAAKGEIAGTELACTERDNSFENDQQSEDPPQVVNVQVWLSEQRLQLLVHGHGIVWLVQMNEGLPVGNRDDSISGTGVNPAADDQLAVVSQAQSPGWSPPARRSSCDPRQLRRT